ncbi:MAG: LysR family transcriptional regulator [Pseudomonadota bacterium]
MWSNIELFLIVAEHGSFTKAAEVLGISAVTLARRISRLEDELGITLLFRGKTGVSLSPEGQTFLDSVSPVADLLTRTVLETQRRTKDALTSPVRISATEPIIADFLAPAFSKLIDKNVVPVEFRVENNPVNLARYEADIALRFARPSGDSLLVRRVCTFKMGVWKHPDYSSDKRPVRFVGYDDKYGDIPERVWLRSAGLEDKIVLQTSSSRSILEVVRSGAAIGILPVVIATGHDLQRADGFPPVAPRPLWMMMHRDVAKRDAVRRTRDWILDVFSKVS